MQPSPMIEQFSRAEFWRSLEPAMHIADVPFMQGVQPMKLEEPTLAALRQLMRIEGYFQIPPQNWQLPIADMAALIARLDAKGWPLPFCFVYDEFWLMYYRLHKLIEGLLGPEYLRLPDFWAWLVNPRKAESGWSPHRDKGHSALFPDGSPKALTVWLPLTDATPLNGCMYIVPADRDPAYGTINDNKPAHKIADIRALPAQAGSVLSWNQAVLHWGSHSSARETLPRISLAFEFQSAKAEPLNTPLTRPQEIPDFEFRLRLIAKQILQYRHMYPLSDDVAAMAQALSGEAPGIR